MELQNQDYAEQWRCALTFGTRTPFYFLDPAFQDTGGYRWWHRRLRDLIAVASLEALATKVSPFPSQRYTFDLTRWAIHQAKQIVMMRSERVWLEAVPELRDHGYVRLSNNQNPNLSRAQTTPEEFERLCGALR